MAKEFQTSFIPKKTADVGVTPRRRAPMNLLMVGGVVILILAVLLSGGIFAYQKLLEKSLASKEKALEDAREEFEPSLIKELMRLDQRITAANDILANHIAASHILGLLEKHTLETVQFTSFDFTKEEEDVGILLAGVANGFTSVALQSDEFGVHPMMKDVLFSDFAVTETGVVSFSVSMAIDSSFVKYDPPSVSVSDTSDENITEGNTGEEQDTGGDNNGPVPSE